MPQYRLMIARFPGNYQEHPCSSNYARHIFGLMRPQEPMKMGVLQGANVECWKCAHPDISEVVLWDRSDTPITMVRNACVIEAQRQQADYLLMIDSDMDPDPLGQVGFAYSGARPFWHVAWEHMMSHLDAPCAIAAPYCGKSPHNNIFVFLWRSVSNRSQEFKLEQFTRDEAAIRGGVEEVAALPTGLILYDMRVFARMPGRSWFYYEYDNDRESAKGSTEDVVQTRDMSLAWYMSGGQKGGKVYCAWDSWARHIKPEHVGRPDRLGAEQVAGVLRKVAREGLDSDEKLMIVGGGNAQRISSEVANGQAVPDRVQGQVAVCDPGAI